MKRRPAVAGMFYESSVEALRRQLEECFAGVPREEIEDADFVCEDVEDAEDAEEVEDADVGEEWREGERLLLLEDFELPRKSRTVGGEREESVWKGRRERTEGKSEEGR